MSLFDGPQAEQENEWGDGFALVDLKENGGSMPVTADNVEEYIEVHLAWMWPMKIYPHGHPVAVHSALLQACIWICKLHLDIATLCA